ncbi:MAG: hypothetical protein AABZ47_04120 [Planctomycetota bacterium]
MRRSRGLILPVVLFVLLLLGLLSAMFMMRVGADMASTRVAALRQQTRLAAEAGVERVKQMLRTGRMDVARWYNNPDEMNRIVVWADGGDPTIWGKSEEFDDGRPAVRFSIVADDPTDDLDFIRFGITDESSKLNLNTASEPQLTKLVTAALKGREDLDPQEIVDAILDWRDTDNQPRSSASDTEGEYYKALDKPYKVKNGPFDTVEELLLVKGVTREVLYGEDFDRNGLLTANEDDGDESFPMDDQDGKLNRGIYPYLTVQSYENNVSNDQRPRVYLKWPAERIRAELEEDFADSPEVIDYIIAAATPQSGRAGASGGPGGAQSGQPGRRGQGATAPPQRGAPIRPGRGGRQAPDPNNAGNEGGEEGAPAGGGKLGPRQQRREPLQPGRRPTPTKPGGNPGTAGGNAEENATEEGEPTVQPLVGDEVPPVRSPQRGAAAGGGAIPSQSGESNDGTKAPKPIRNPASLFLTEVVKDGQPQESPLKPEHLAVVMDRMTLRPAREQRIPGMININSAAPEVLRCLDGLTEEQVQGIVSKRTTLDSEILATTAWLVTEEVMDIEAYEMIATSITARGQQFAIESLGFADHAGIVTRLHVVVDMIGPIAQTIYYRDESYLGSTFPIRFEDKEKIRAR